MCDDGSHRDAIQATAQLALDRMSRDLDHIASIVEGMAVEDTEAIDAMTVLSECGANVHELMHRLDDSNLRWAREKHVAAVLVDG